MKFVTNVSNFSAGLMSKKLFGRTDVREYSNALSISKNAFISTQGGAYKRQALQTVAQLPPDQTEVQIETLQAGLNKTGFLVFSQFSAGLCNWRLYDARGNATTGYGSISGTVGEFVVVPYEEYYVIVSSEGDTEPTYLKVDTTAAGKIIVEGVASLNPNSYYAYPQTDVNLDVNKRLRVTNVTGSQGATGLQSNGWNIQEEFSVGDWVMITGVTYFGKSPLSGTNPVGQWIKYRSK